MDDVTKIRVPQKLIRLIKTCTESSKGKIKIDNHLSKSFDINSDVRQGDGLSLLLFNLVLEKALQRVREHNIGVRLNTQQLNILAYADDIYY